jgi:hypothetical protein
MMLEPAAFFLALLVILQSRGQVDSTAALIIGIAAAIIALVPLLGRLR